MGAGGSAAKYGVEEIKAASKAELTAAYTELSKEERQKIMASLPEGSSNVSAFFSPGLPSSTLLHNSWLSK